jgi:hypothetical protein
MRLSDGAVAHIDHTSVAVCQSVLRDHVHRQIGGTGRSLRLQYESFNGWFDNLDRHQE